MLRWEWGGEGMHRWETICTYVPRSDHSEEPQAEVKTGGREGGTQLWGPVG